MNWRPPRIEELHAGLSCEIIDMIASADQIQDAIEAKKHFKRDVIPNVCYKSHVLTAADVEYYTMNPQLINRDLRINKE